MNQAQWAILLCAGVFIGMVICLDVGFRIGYRNFRNDPVAAHKGLGSIEAAVFALLGLLLAFAFSGGVSRLDGRRQLIVQEANAIGTAYLRVDLLPVADQPEMRRMFREYVDVRLKTYDNVRDPNAFAEDTARAVQMQQDIWSRAVTASAADPNRDLGRLLLPAINEMIDVTTSRTVALHTRLPALIFGLLISMALLSGVFAGYAMAERKRRSWLHVIFYSLVVAITVYVIVDLDDPQFGLIRLRGADNAMIQLRDSMK